ncbi:uncharacterized protein si:zfos-905g2.1 [Myxocyprinus asiaticus]|uniref:uncharacterized protein si:zfos-905g2.1 n=1 Tax=Myxocyprinus asiaticus TaxID=70543 RepID=UPI0022237D00|nr:uncharacterized protein si:zfos-905g2.1 [Myxocyprinus asiaticus]
MKVKLEADADSPSQSFSNSGEGSEANNLSDSDFVVVKLEDEDEDQASETEMDLSIFAPVESECEEDELSDSDSSGVSTWRRKHHEEQQDNQEDSATPENQSSSRSLKGCQETSKNLVAKQRRKQNPVCSAENRGVNLGLPPEDLACYQAVPLSDSARAPAEMSGLDTAISPLAAMEPPVFPNTPVLSKSVVGEDQQNILLEVLNHCRYLHEAVQRLEQKVDRQMANEPPYQRSSAKQKNGPKRQASLPVEEEQLSWSLTQRLGPPVQRNPQWIPPWKLSSAERGPGRADLQQLDNYSQQLAKPPGGGRGRGRGRGRGCRGHNSRSKPQSQTPHLAQLTSNPIEDGISTGEMEDPQPSKVMKKDSRHNTGSKGQQKKRKNLAQVDGAEVETKMVSNKKKVTPQVDLDTKVMIGSSLRKVWIPMSVYKEVFKEIEPQKAVVPVLHALFPISTLSCSAVTGNPIKGIQQLDPNIIEALREFLAEMYPQYDVSVRGVTWAQCLGVINNITKNLKKKAGTSHLTEVGGRPALASFPQCF